MEQTGARPGGEYRLVLGFDAGCMTCSELAKRIEERVGNRIEVRSLNDPQMNHWRKEVFGEAAPWAPTLVEVKAGKVRAWTGVRMGARLSRALGPLATWRLMRAVVAAREVSFAGMPAATISGTSLNGSLSRGQFMKRVGTGALAAAVSASGLGAFSSRAFAADAAGASANVSGTSLTTEAERRRFDQAVGLLSRHLRADSNGTLRVSDARVSEAIQSGEEQGIPRKVFRELAASLEIANEQIVEGELPGGPKLISPGLPAVTEHELRSKDLESEQRASRSCRGRSGGNFHWWGVRIYLNSCEARNLIYLCTIGAGAAALCNKIGPIPCRIAGFLLLVTCATYQRAAAPGRGIVIDKSWGLKLPRVYSQ
jgi:predicted DCC family thiol-disulfide oxidoreductase YuxK